MLSYNDRTFRPINNTQNGDINEETIFHYQQHGFLVSATYTGGPILFGHILGLADADGVMELRYHHVNHEGDIMTGICVSTPELMPNGKIRLHEKWKWTCRDESEGESVIEEIDT